MSCKETSSDNQNELTECVTLVLNEKNTGILRLGRIHGTSGGRNPNDKPASIPLLCEQFHTRMVHKIL